MDPLRGTPTTDEDTFRTELSQLAAEWQGILRTLVASRCSDVPDGASSHELAEALEAATADRVIEQMAVHPPQLMVLTAPSGVGKGTVGGLLEKTGFARLPRHTTRARRANEREGYDYYYVTRERFTALREGGELLWHRDPLAETPDPTAESHATGLGRTALWEAIAADSFPYVDGGKAAAASMKQALAGEGVTALVLFLLPPSLEVMAARIEERNQRELAAATTSGEKAQVISQADILKRMRRAIEHLRDTATNVDVYVVNDVATRAAGRILRVAGLAEGGSNP